MLAAMVGEWKKSMAGEWKKSMAEMGSLMGTD
jgi:hypothetical protein